MVDCQTCKTSKLLSGFNCRFYELPKSAFRWWDVGQNLTKAQRNNLKKCQVGGTYHKLSQTHILGANWNSNVQTVWSAERGKGLSRSPLFLVLHLNGRRNGAHIPRQEQRGSKTPVPITVKSQWKKNHLTTFCWLVQKLCSANTKYFQLVWNETFVRSISNESG